MRLDLLPKQYLTLQLLKLSRRLSKADVAIYNPNSDNVIACLEHGDIVLSTGGHTGIIINKDKQQIIFNADQIQLNANDIFVAGEDTIPGWELKDGLTYSRKVDDFMEIGAKEGAFENPIDIGGFGLAGALGGIL